MNQKIINTIMFKNGDSIVINEATTGPTSNKVMSKIKQAEKNAVITSSNSEIIIPVDNILFAVSSSYPIDLSEASCD